LALSISAAPWQGPLSAVRIGKQEGKFVLNPTYAQRRESPMDFLIGTLEENNKTLLNMIEAEAEEVPESEFEQAFSFAKPFLEQMTKLQKEMVKEHGKEKMVLEDPPQDLTLENEAKELIGNKLEQALFQGDKKARMDAVNELKKEVVAIIDARYPGLEKGNYIKEFFEREIDRLMRTRGLKEGLRVDDRKTDELRQLAGRVSLLPRTHGSALFERGQTKTLSILTLGTPGDHKLMEGMEFSGKKRFMHHYNFPPYSTGEVKPMRGPGRREIGHGMLAEKALLPVIPTVDEFPYTIRIVTECLSSNGSTSMASVCSATLALMDAGVPIKKPVAGISVGLLTDPNSEDYKILTDIQGPEDHHGDMDFKVAGTKDGITAIQMDVKVKGITEEIFKNALEAARKARHTILDEVISRVLPEPRKELSKWAPRIYILQINREKIGELIGPGGKMIRQITEECEVEIDVEDDGKVFITSIKEEGAKKALEWIQNMMREPVIGETYQGRVVSTLAFGAFVEIFPGQEGLVHISELAPHRVARTEDVVKVGDVIPVKVLKIDGQGKVSLSLKQAKNS
ncbi:MAG: polyribonucleotide nucleotidyltransferase, partial [bacterium]|nr:polyribonucleotide nucleotidyltransferase [bacterium]